MTSEEKFFAILKRLHAKTKAGQTEWEETPSTGVFQTSFPNYTIKLWADGNDYYISILDGLGATLESYSDAALTTAFPGGNAFPIMRELYAMARRRALGVDAALDSLLRELE
jgi:hypothetical protein